MKKVKKEEFFEIDLLEQYNRILNLEFDGVSNLVNENVTDIVIEISKKRMLRLKRAISLSFISSCPKNLKLIIRHLGHLQ